MSIDEILTPCAADGSLYNHVRETMRDRLETFLALADKVGLVVTIHLEPQKPLAMRNYKPVIEITEKR